ncbi:MAG: guanylate kinase [Bacteroidales bacterium]|nr:guanylate kinase [Bacteroidales bacterium]
MNKLIIVSAPSGAGKTTLVKELMQEEELKLMFSISAASRKPRENEINGKDYHFLSVDNFKEKIKNDEFIEWEEVYNNQFYGTLKSEVKRVWNLNKNLIFDVDVKGGLNIKKTFPENSISIFIKPPSIEELKKRLQKRGTETEESFKKRIEKAKFEMTFANEFDVTITNDNLKKAIDEIKKVVGNFILKQEL